MTRNLSREIQQFAESVGQTEEALRARLTKERRLDSITEQVRHRKALDLVILPLKFEPKKLKVQGRRMRMGEDGRMKDRLQLDSQVLITRSLTRPDQAKRLPQASQKRNFRLSAKQRIMNSRLI